jgi:hypothetical protein
MILCTSIAIDDDEDDDNISDTLFTNGIHDGVSSSLVLRLSIIDA